jgi:hypothetical protein
MSFNVKIDSIPFEITIDSGEYRETWTARVLNHNDMIKLIDTIEKHTIVRYGGEDTEASSLFARELRNKIIMLNPNYHTEIENKLLAKINIDEIIRIDIKLGNGPNITTLCYGSNGYDDELGWYFDSGGHSDSRNYPFFEWAENEYKAKIRAFDGGNSRWYDEFLKNAERERLRKKL